MQQYCGETVGNELFNVGEYWADLRCARPAQPALHTLALLLHDGSTTLPAAAAALPYTAV